MLYGEEKCLQGLWEWVRPNRRFYLQLQITYFRKHQPLSFLCMFPDGCWFQKVGFQLSIHIRGPRCTTGPPSHCGSVPQSSLDWGSPGFHTWCDVWRGLKSEASREGRQLCNCTQQETLVSVLTEHSDELTVCLLTSEKMHGQTNQSQQLSALHDRPGPGSLA